MHVLGHGFGSRRKSSTKRPRDLHIRKISFSGSSLSSACSLSSSTSTPVATPTARTPTTATSSTFRPEFDPLQLNPAFHAPPRLFERPFKNIDPVPEVFGYDNDEEEDIIVHEDAEEHTPQKALPASVNHDEDLHYKTQEPSDYFFNALAPPPQPQSRRPSAVNLSRWSESTIASLDFEVNQDSESEEEDTTSDFEDDDDNDVLEMRRLSRRASHRAAALQTLSLNIAYTARPVNAPKRPPMRSLDSVDNYIRRGGWKRRGIVFRAEEAEDMESVTRQAERASY
ncbi:hypothetical protein BGZ63DRAFT_372463 [Mariannaea sp. PMI_226]|nr:hypothetical protein BGZ63DRAFT_372463 [Mariannaea sp. PMI_226]